MLCVENELFINTCLKQPSGFENTIDKQALNTAVRIQKDLKASILDLENFCQYELPQLQTKQKELTASLEKLAQNAMPYKR